MKAANTAIASLKELVRDFRNRRDWGQFHAPKDLSMSIAIEAAELMEQFQWLASEESRQLREDEKELAILDEELADVLIYCLSSANSLDIGMTSVAMDKLAKNAWRYPEDDFKPRS